MASSKGISKAAATRPSQKSLLGAVVRKRKSDLEEANHLPTPDNEIPKQIKKAKITTLQKGALQCIGILPGIGKYEDSSDSEASESSDIEDYKATGIFDIVNRKICTKESE